MYEMNGCLGTRIFLADNFSDLSYHVNAYGSKTLWVCDTNTARMVRPLPDPHVIIENGESSKCWRSVEQIISTAVDNGLGRDCTFIALGGGVVCDTTAFAASIYMRGCKVVFIPTTLLCMVDACIGGKTGIDFKNGINLIGSFFPANEVIICTDTLKSLGSKELVNGLSEVIKHSLLTSNDNIYNLLVQQKQQILDKDPKVLRDLVALSLDVKASFIEQDPYERKGIRQALNFGHTFGHALESLSRLQWSHGEAVAWGCCRAMEVSKELGLCDPQFADGVLKLFAYYGYDIRFKISREEWLEYKTQLLKDKKKVNNTMQFVLLKGQGDYVLMDVDEEVIKKVVLMPAMI